MSTGSLSVVRDTILKSALRLVGAYNSLTNPRPQQLEDANTALQFFIKALQVDPQLWLKTFVTLFPQQGVSSYSIPGCYGATTYYTTAVAVDSTSTVEVASISDITELDVIGIVLDDGSIHWTSVVSISGVILTLTETLPSQASTGNVVYSYHSSDALKRPTNISTMTYTQDSTNSEIPLCPLSRSDYVSSPNKTTQGVPVGFYYDRQLSTGELYLWPVPSSDLFRLTATFDRPIEVPENAGDAFDLPAEYMELLKYGLAVRLAPEYALASTDMAHLKDTYDTIYYKITSYNIEQVSTFFSPGRS